MQKNRASSYGLAPQQETASFADGKPEHESMVAIAGDDDNGPEQRGDDEEHRLLPTDLNASMDAASDATEERLSWQPSPDGAISSPGGGSATENSVPETTTNVDDDLRRSFASLPATPEASLLSENPQLSLSPDGRASKLVHDTVSVNSASTPAALEENSFPAKTRWERAVRKAEAVAAFVRGSDSEAETHWRLSTDGEEDVVPREYAEDFHQKDAELHPSQRRVVVNIRSLSVSTSPKRRTVDEENPSEREETQTAAHLAAARQAQQSDR